MSEQLIEILAKTRSGIVQPFRVMEIISIDGKPYVSTQNLDLLVENLNDHERRLTALETKEPKEG